MLHLWICKLPGGGHSLAEMIANTSSHRFIQFCKWTYCLAAQVLQERLRLFHSHYTDKKL